MAVHRDHSTLPFTNLLAQTSLEYGAITLTNDCLPRHLITTPGAVVRKKAVGPTGDNIVDAKIPLVTVSLEITKSRSTDEEKKIRYLNKKEIKKRRKTDTR